MHDDTITRLPEPSGFAPERLTEVIRAGARKFIEQAIDAELAALLGANAKGLSATTITRLKADWWQYDEACRNATSARGGFSTSGRMTTASSRG